MGVYSRAALLLAALRETSPEELRETVLSALRSGGSVPGGALVLGVSATTLRAWVRSDSVLSEAVAGLSLRRRGNPLMGPGYGNRKKKREVIE